VVGVGGKGVGVAVKGRVAVGKAGGTWISKPGFKEVVIRQLLAARISTVMAYRCARLCRVSSAWIK
jgi:hypothetical protein